MEHVELDTGIRAAFRAVGPSDAERLLLLAPMGRDHSPWEAHLPRLSRELRCIVPDYRGTGESERPESGYSLAELAGDALALLDVLEIERAHVAGSSMGAAVAIELALADPERVRSLSLYTPWARTDASLREALRMLRSLTAHAAPLDVERALSWLLFSPEYLSERLEEIEEHARATVESPAYPPRHAAIGHIEAGIDHDVLDRLGTLTAPALVVAGERDRFIPRPHAEQVRDGLPGARYHLFRGVGSSHGLAVERLDEFLDVALGFLRGAARSATESVSRRGSVAARSRRQISDPS